MEGKKSALYRGLLLLAALMLLIPAVSTVDQVRAESATQSIAVTIPETLRINIDRNEIVFSERHEGENGVLYPAANQEKMNVKVLSNSPQTWRLRVNTSDAQGQLEWSLDGNNWRTVGEGQEVLNGSITNGWKEYAVYYRLRQTADETDAVQLVLTYELMTLK